MQRDCTSIQELLVDFVDDDLAPAERQRVREHLVACPDCRAVADRLRTSLVLAHDLWKVSAGEASPAAARRRRPVIRAGIGLAAALAVAVTAWLVVPRGNDGPAPIRVAGQPEMLDVDTEALIARESAAARLLAAAEVLSSAPKGEAYACARFEYIARVFPESPSALVAQARLRERCKERNLP